VNRSKVFKWYSRFRDGRDLVDDDERGDRPKSTWTEVNIAAVADLVKNDRRLSLRMIAISLNNFKALVLRILKEDFGERKLFARFVPPSTDTWAKGRSSHILPRHYRDGRCRQFFKQNYYGKWDLVFCLWPQNKATEFWMGETSPRPKKQISKVPHQDSFDHFFRLSRRSVQRISTRGKTVNAEFYKRLMDLLLKRIRRVRPAAFCSRDFFLFAR
jgi:hypothetical protein